MPLRAWQMRCDREQLDGLTVVSPIGRLGHGSVHLLGDALVVPEEMGVVVDLQRLDYISGAGLAAIRDAADRARADARPFAVCGVEGSVRIAFELAGLLSALNVQPSRERAVASVR